MNRAETVATIIATLKQSLVKSSDFIELWVINDLIDDDHHRKLIVKNEVGGIGCSALSFNQETFEQINEPHGVYKDNHIKVNFIDHAIYVNVDAIYRIAAPAEYLAELNRRFAGEPWTLSTTPGYVTINISTDCQTKYFKGYINASISTHTGSC